MRQLCLTVAGLEEARSIYGDIHSGNMFLDSSWNSKLSDLDRTVGIGEEITVLTEPFGRLRSDEEGKPAGIHCKADARREAFAIGSSFYSLLRGYGP